MSTHVRSFIYFSFTDSLKIGQNRAFVPNFASVPNHFLKYQDVLVMAMICQFHKKVTYCTSNKYNFWLIFLFLQISPTEACTRGITRMMYCPQCRGLTRTKPCNNYCLNTMKGCLAHHSELNKAWNEYIGRCPGICKSVNRAQIVLTPPPYVISDR